MKTIFKIPSPKDLGFEYNTLSKKDWDEYYSYIKNMYPISFYIKYKIFGKIKKYKRNFHDFYWYLQYQFNPKHKYHYLKLSNPGGGFNYQYGFLDPPEKILFANFIILTDFFNKECYPYWCKHGIWPFDESTMSEIKKLYFWWTRDREME